MAERTKFLHDLLPDLEDLARDLTVTGLVMDSRDVEPGNALSRSADSVRTVCHSLIPPWRMGLLTILFEPPAPEQFTLPTDAVAVPNLRARMGEMADLFPRPSVAANDGGRCDGYQRQDIQFAAHCAGLGTDRYPRRHDWHLGCGPLWQCRTDRLPRHWSCGFILCWRTCTMRALKPS